MYYNLTPTTKVMNLFFMNLLHVWFYNTNFLLRSQFSLKWRRKIKTIALCNSLQWHGELKWWWNELNWIQYRWLYKVIRLVQLLPLLSTFQKPCIPIQLFSEHWQLISIIIVKVNYKIWFPINGRLLHHLNIFNVWKTVMLTIRLTARERWTF